MAERSGFSPTVERPDDGPPRRVRRGVWLFPAVAALVMVGLAAGRGPAPKVYETAAVERRDLEETIMAAGRILPRDFVDVGAQVSGQLARLHVGVGDRVASGDLLAEIDAEVETAEVEALRAERAGLEAELAEQQADLAFAEGEMRRSEALAQRAALSQTAVEASRRDLAKSRARVEGTRARIAQATATLKAREAALRRAAIRAPISGVVVAIEAREGQTLNANYDTPLILTIADLDTMTVWTEVSEADVPRLRAGMPVWFTTLGAPETRRRAVLRQILPVPPRAAGEAGKDGMAIDAKVIVYLALFDVPNPDRALRGGMTAQVFFVEAEAPGALAVPVAALTGADAVRVEASDGRIETRAVQTGLRTRFFVAVEEGLAEGERVVVGEPPAAASPLIRVAP